MTDKMVMPDGSHACSRPPDIGALVAFNHAVWRVIDVRPVPPDQWTEDDRRRVNTWKPAYRDTVAPAVVVLRPVHITSDDPRARDHDRHYRHGGHRTWWVYRDEHYPVCAACGEPTPCRERLNERIALRLMESAARYENPAACPACGDPFTQQQKVVTFPDNMEFPDGPPVTYHAGRAACRAAARSYEKRWLEADPEHRQPLVLL